MQFSLGFLLPDYLRVRKGFTRWMSLPTSNPSQLPLTYLQLKGSLMDDQLLLEQLSLEEEMREATIEWYFTKHDKGAAKGSFSDTHAGRNLFDHLFENFLNGVEAWCEEKRAGGVGRRPRALHLIEDFGDNKTLVFLFLRGVINSAFKRTRVGTTSYPKVTKTILSASDLIHDEHRMRYFEEHKSKLLKKIIKDFRSRDLPRERAKQMMIATFKAQQMEWRAKGWGTKERVNLGLVLLEILIKTTGVVQTDTIYEGNKSYEVLYFTPELEKALLSKMEKAAPMFTRFYPTVIPPKNWVNGQLIGGGYYTDNVHPVKFIKTAGTRFLQELNNRDMSQVLDAVNAMQRTAWRINKDMLGVLEETVGRGIEVKGLALADDKELPEMPYQMEKDSDEWKAHMRTRYEIREFNRRMISKRVALMRTISLARKFSKYGAIYFPHSLDFRGRAYPLPAFLNPQGPDYVKGLLEFSEGKPIDTPEHAAFLAIAIANAWGQDKLPLQERVDWVEANEAMLLEVAKDPLFDLRWTQAGEPFMALRGAIEWSRFCEQGFGVLSHMPVHFDATCSGLQHFSAILRDHVGGRFVNLTSSDVREDIYGEVARKSLLSLQLEADGGNTYTNVAIAIGVTRGLCKRPVMIVPYAGTFKACMEYVADYYDELFEEGTVMPMEKSEFRQNVVPLVAKHVWEAISTTVIAAREAMTWITKTARLASNAGQRTPIQWETPDGFIVRQETFDTSMQRIETYLDGGRRVQTAIKVEKPHLDPRSTSQSLSPNYIHSLDACHLRMTINRALQIGITDFAMIHDSFGVHAAEMPRFLEECIKPTFVEMYANGGLLEKLREELSVNIAEDKRSEIEPIPAQGSLDVTEVLESQFFFS